MTVTGSTGSIIVRTAADVFAQPGPFLVSELSLVLRCSSRFVQKLIQAGALDAGRVGRNYRISATEARRLVLQAIPDAKG